MSAPEIADRIAVIEAKPYAEESLRWRVAVAVNDEGAYCGGCDYEDGLDCSECRKCCLDYADAAIRVICNGEDPS